MLGKGGQPLKLHVVGRCWEILHDGRLLLGSSNAKKWDDHKKKKFFTNNSMAGVEIPVWREWGYLQKENFL